MKHLDDTIRTLIITGVATILLVFAHIAQSQESDENLINWYYAHEFGTGAYKVGDNSVQIFRFPISYTYRELISDKWGIKFILPMTIGYHNFKFKALDIIDKILEEEFASITLTPGVELNIPFYFNTTLFPYAYAGYGKETSGGTSAWIYGAGIRLLDEYRWRLSTVMTGGAFTFSGYKNSVGDNRGTTSIRVGMNIITPLDMTLFEKQANWGAHFVIYFYFNELDFESEEQQPIQINNEYEVAFTLGTQKPMSLLGLEFDRFGLAYRWAEELRAIRLVASFPF